MTVPHLPRTVRLAALAAVAGLVLGGCSAFSPQTTSNVTYAPSDGVQGEVGDIAVRNLFVLTAEQGAAAELVGSLFNSSGEDVSLVIDVENGAGSETVEVPAGQSVTLGPQADAEVAMESLDILPGRTAEVTFVGSGGNLNLSAPVLDGTLPEYAELLSDEG